MMRFNQPPPRPMNPAAPRQFGMAGQQPRPQMLGQAMQRPAQPRPQMPQQMAARPMGQMAPRPMAPRAPAPQNPMMGGAMARMGGAMMSDERSKKRIQELESLNDHYSALLDTPSATGDVKPKAPPTTDLDRSNARALGEAGSYSYEYKDPRAPGAASGRQAGPMAQELEGIPGVVRPGLDGMKRVDPGRLALATASATGDQERRLRALESDYDALSDDEISQGLAAGETRALDAIRGAGGHAALREGSQVPREKLRAAYGMGSEEDEQLSRDLAEGERSALARIRGGR